MRFKQRAASELDNPARWSLYLKPYVDVDRWQKRIDTAIGLDARGLSIVRIIWAQDVTQRIFNEETPRYWLRRRGKVYWRVARYVYEVRLEPEIYAAAWERTRYSVTDPLEGSTVRCSDCGASDPILIRSRLHCRKCAGTNIAGGAVVDKGPPPDEYFVFLTECARHEAVDPSNGQPYCCTRAFYGETQWGSSHSRCWGEYRPPIDDDIALIKRTIEATASNPYTPLTPQQLAETELAANKQVERAESDLSALEDAMLREEADRFLAGRVYSGAAGPLRKPTAIQNLLLGIENPHS